MSPVIVITARAGSKRLPGKNMLPLGGAPLAVHTLRHAKATGLRVVVSTDIPDLQRAAVQLGCELVMRPPALATDDCSHRETIEHALRVAGAEDAVCVLLQPTSPFRTGDIIGRCLAAYRGRTVVSTQVIHHGEFWDGCVAVFAPGKVCDFTDVDKVRNAHLNTLQIDTEADYIDACVLAETTLPSLPPLSTVQSVAEVRAALNAAIPVGEVSLVARGDASRQDAPVVHLNQCAGYTGGRCDAVVLVANTITLHFGINPAMRACLDAAKVIILRDNGQLAKTRDMLAEYADKVVALTMAPADRGRHVTTGAVASWLLRTAGYRVEHVAFARPGDRHAALGAPSCYAAGASYEIAVLRESGAW